MEKGKPKGNIIPFPGERSQNPLLHLAMYNAQRYGRPVLFDAPAVAAQVAAILKTMKPGTAEFRHAVIGIENDLHETWDHVRFVQPLYVQAVHGAELVTYQGVMSDIIFESDIANWDASINLDTEDFEIADDTFVPYLQMLNASRLVGDTTDGPTIAVVQIPFSSIVGIYEQE